MKYFAVLGRILYAIPFILALPTHFMAQSIAFAAAQGVPFAPFTVPASGVMAAIGGISIALGYKARYGAMLIAGFLVPVTLMMHNFWAVPDPMMAQLQMAFFIKNFALFGVALYIIINGAGLGSLDLRAASRANLAHA